MPQLTSCFCIFFVSTHKDIRLSLFCMKFCPPFFFLTKFQGYIFYLLLQTFVGEKKNEKAKTGKGKNWKFTHFWREIAFFHILTIFFTLFLSCFLFYVYFFLSLILFFFFSLFSCCRRDFWHGCRHFVGFLYPIFIFFSSPCLDFFIPYFCAAGGISPLF